MFGFQHAQQSFSQSNIFLLKGD